MAVEKYFVDRAALPYFTSLEKIVSEIDNFPVKVESSQNPKPSVGTRPDHFSARTFDELANVNGILPMIFYEAKKELVVGVREDSIHLTEDRNALSFTGFDLPFDTYLPNVYRVKHVSSDNVVPIMLGTQEYNTLYRFVASPQERTKFIQEKKHLESESTFDIMSDPAARNILRQIYRRAVALQASDIHLEWTEHGPRVRYRVNDLLQDDPIISPFSSSRDEVSVDRFKNIIGAIKVDSGESGIITHEHRRTQSGAFDFDKIDWGKEGSENKFSQEDLPTGQRARVSILPSIYGENVALRLLKKGQLLSLNQLGYPSSVIKQLEEISTEPHGIIIATGPTGSGKTTTLNAIIEHSNTPDQKIITLENPVEYTIHGVHQCEVGKLNSFEAIMKEILRHDPDTVMIGEIRDKSTADVAINLALTGHLAYATLHTNEAIGTVLRLQRMGIQDYELQDTLRAAFAQRLVRVLCSECKIPDLESNINSLFRDNLYNNNLKLYKQSEKGCDACHHTGIIGRSAITEIWQISEEARDMVGRGVNSGLKYLEQAVKEGMRPISMAALDYLADGKISFNEVVRVVGLPTYKNRQEVLKKLVPEKLAH